MLLCQINICHNFNMADERFSRLRHVFRLYLKWLYFKLFSNFIFLIFCICLYGFKLDISSSELTQEGWRVVLAMKGLLQILKKLIW